MSMADAGDEAPNKTSDHDAADEPPNENAEPK
jgi:hypothetical protein